MLVLLRSRKFLTALLGVLMIAADMLFPTAPSALFDAANTFVLALIAIFTVQDTALYLRGIHPRAPPRAAAKAFELPENPLSRLWASKEFKTTLVALLVIVLSIGLQFPAPLVTQLAALFAWLIGAEVVESLAYRIGYPK